ncbi:MAG TPA: VTT domain-containing protein, partial [Gemmatimonadaceae bacterium]|nr:VTT domain-containing protein [Gemmatimonadaceae bacterium]
GVMNALHRWAESGWSGTAVLSWGVVQGSVMPGPTEGLLLPLSLADPRRTYKLTALAAIGSILGGMCAWYIGRHLFSEVGMTLLVWLGMTEPRLEVSRDLVERYGWMLIAFSAIAPISTKTVCITAGVLRMPFPEFVLGITIGRVIRFTIVALALKFAGQRLRAWILRRTGRTRVHHDTEEAFPVSLEERQRA